MTSSTFTARLRSHLSKPLLVRMDWLARVAPVAGKALHLGVALCYLAASQRTPTIRLSHAVLRRYAISRDAAYDGLRRLEANGNIRVNRSPGVSPRVTLLDSRGEPLVVVP
jgi:hypothetical protein